MRLRWIMVSLGSTLLSPPGSVTAQPMPASQPVPMDIDDAPEPEPEAVTFGQLRDQLGAASARERQVAAMQLGQLGDRRAVPLLVRVLRTDRSAAVRAAAARSLGFLKARKQASALRMVARADRAPVVRAAARAALTGMGLSLQPPAPGRSPLLGRRDTSYQRTSAYRTAQTMRLSGILITSVGGGLGLLVGVVGAGAYSRCMDEYPPGFPAEYQVHCTMNRNGAIVGFVVAGASLAAGIPLWVLGSRRMQAARTQHRTAMLPRVQLGARRVSLRWQF